MTGAGARLTGADASTLSLLYDFEELEGELDFLTRVVALTFYPGASGRTPLTLGEVHSSSASLMQLYCRDLLCRFSHAWSVGKTGHDHLFCIDI